MSASPFASAGTRFSTRPLVPSFGVEVSGFTFSTDPDAGAMREIQALADRHFVLLFRNQAVSEAAHVAFSKALGPVIPPLRLPLHRLPTP